MLLSIAHRMQAFGRRGCQRRRLGGFRSALARHLDASGQQGPVEDSPKGHSAPSSSSHHLIISSALRPYVPTRIRPASLARAMRCDAMPCSGYGAPPHAGTACHGVLGPAPASCACPSLLSASSRLPVVPCRSAQGRPSARSGASPGPSRVHRRPFPPAGSGHQARHRRAFAADVHTPTPPPMRSLQRCAKGCPDQAQRSANSRPPCCLAPNRTPACPSAPSLHRCTVSASGLARPS